MAGKDRPGAGGDDVEEPKRVRWGPGNVSGSRESPTPARSDCRGRRNSARRARSSHSDRAGRYGGVCEINGVTLGIEAKKNLVPIQPGDVPATYADVDDLVRDVGFKPRTTIEDGVARFVTWYRQYHKPHA